jgi:hypothetical protein
VKAGHPVPAYVRELEAVRQQHGADLGVLISFATPTPGLLGEAAGFGFYESPWGKHQRIQLRTVGELLGGKGIDYPHVAGANVTHKKAAKLGVAPAETMELFSSGPSLSD